LARGDIADVVIAKEGKYKRWRPTKTHIVALVNDDYYCDCQPYMILIQSLHGPYMSFT
jgi:hypothetical protein